MVAKKIDLGPGLNFESIAKAKDHFDRILKGTPIDQRVTDTEFKSLKPLYEAYCTKTNWPCILLPNRSFRRTSSKNDSQQSALASSSRTESPLDFRWIRH